MVASKTSIFAKINTENDVDVMRSSKANSCLVWFNEWTLYCVEQTCMMVLPRKSLLRRAVVTVPEATKRLNKTNNGRGKQEARRQRWISTRIWAVAAWSELNESKSRRRKKREEVQQTKLQVCRDRDFPFR